MSAPTLMHTNHSRSQRIVEWLHLGYLWPFVVLTLCAAATYLLWQNAQQHAAEELKDKFDFRVHDAIEAIEKRMKTYEQIMRGVQGSFDDSVNERDEFREYVANLQLDQDYPGIHAVGYAPLIADAEKDRHIAAIHSEGFPEYTVSPPGRRQIYAPVTLIEPFSESSRWAFGHDLYSDQELRAAMERARDSGRVAITGKVRLVQDTDEHAQSGFMMFLPVYRYGLPHNTLGERRANNIGWVYAKFRMGDFLAGIGGESNAEFDFDIYDGEEVSEKTVMYDPHDRPTHMAPNARFQTTHHIAVADHGWTMVALSLPGFEAKLDKEKPQILASAGTGISLLLTLLAWLMVSGRARALQAAAAVERESRRNETLLRTASDGIYVFDLEGNVVQVNDAFCKMLGYTQKEMLSMNVAQWNAQGSAEELKTMISALGSSNPVFETRHRRRDGSIVDVEVSASRVEIGGEQLIYNSVRDISERLQAHAKLLKLSSAVENSPASVVITDMHGKIEYVNRRFTAVTGYQPDEVVGQEFEMLGAGTEGDEFPSDVWQTIRAGKEWQGDIFNARKNGEIYLEHTSISPICDEKGAITHFVVVAEDITERKQFEEKLQKADKDRALLAVRHEEEERLRAIIDTALDAVVQMNSEGIITGWNNQATRIFGWTREQALGQVMHETIIPPQYRMAHVQGLHRFLSSGEQSILNSRIELLGMHRDGHEFPIELSITAVKTGAQYEFNAFIRDITERKVSEELIWKQANFDLLTQLPNRRMFHDRLAQEIKKANRASLPLALLFIDLDRFKEVNDTLGHDIGDTLLVEAARRIVSCVREADTVARLGGDEFTVILGDAEEMGSVERVTENILEKLAEPFQLGSDITYVSASIGITLYPNDATELEGLLKNADQAMYVAKNQGRNRFSYFTPMLQEAALARLHMTNDLRNAMAANQLLVYFQPIVDLASGRIKKAEALVRWQHPEHGLIYPSNFIPLAEETGLIFEIGDWVFQESARWVKRWTALFGNADFQVSVNKSPVQFRLVNGQPNTWLAYLREIGLPGKNVGVEITEGLLLAADSPVNAALLTFRDAGIQVAIDDFGTGYSALSYLKKFDIDYLKIDQSFIRNLAPGSSDMALSEAIIVMAHKLGLKVIAEGVETEEQRDLLIAAGCDYAQGYLYSRPVPPDQLELMLRDDLLRGNAEPA
ncbi:putative signaling protein [Gallionellaceae bacterium]|nr:putative signaling protein [Gallionellaceae bacterium]